MRLDHQTRTELRPRSLVLPTLLLLMWLPSVASLSAHAQQKEGEIKCGVSALSLNLHGTRNSQTILAGLRPAGGLERVDLMLFQEVVRPRQGGQDALDQLAQALGMHLSFATEFERRDGNQEGLAVLSRYPVLESRVIPLPHYNLLWKSRRRVALALLVQTPLGPFRVYNLHLDTRVNLKARLQQLQPIAEEAAAAPGPVLVGGDFNTNPFRWGAHTVPLLVAPDQGVGVLRFMSRLGYRSAFPRRTPTSRYLRMQLDWLFLRNLQAGPTAIRPTSFSDHHALYACLQLTPTLKGARPAPQLTASR